MGTGSKAEGSGGYGELLRRPSYRNFWLGFTASVLGDAMTRVAFTWIVYERTHSAQALALLTVAYTAPVLIGGLLAGPLLDRFDRSRVMLVDNVLRGIVMALVPILYAFDALSLTYVYIAAAIYNFLMMISLAGGPALIPSLVEKRQLSSANALETLSYTLAGVIGAPLAGVLIAGIGAPWVVALDAASYIVFAIALASIRLPAKERPSHAAGASYGLGEAVNLFLGSKILLSTTLMFMAYNIAFGAVTVWLPFFADRIGSGGPQTYGLLLGLMALGECASAFLAGVIRLPFTLGTAIALSQALAGLSLTVLLLGPRLGWAAAAFILVGIFSSPLTIWAQTLRMRIIPEPMRGRAFALLRTMMQGATPLGGALAGFALAGAGLVPLIVCTASLMGLPGLVGWMVRDLRRADHEPPPEPRNPPTAVVYPET